jgi:hypothetical protein
MRAGSLVLVGVASALATFVTSVGAASAAACPPPPPSVQPFTSYGDTNDYVLTTGGSFESGTPSWSLAGGAAVVGDNAPNALDPASNSHALSLPAGATATSPCTTAPNIVGIVRFFAKAASPSAQLKVEVLVKGGTYLAGTIGAGGSWAPTPTLNSNAPAYSGAVAYQVRLTAIGGGFTVDDVYFDPYCSK